MKTILHFIRVFFTLTFRDYRGIQNIYTVKKNHFYARGPRTLDQVGRSLTFNVTFSNDCWYSEKDIPRKEMDICKVYGITEYLNPHKSSMRIGWMPSTKENELDLYAYYYVLNNEGRKERAWQYMTTIHVVDNVRCEISRHEGYWQVRIHDVVKYVFTGFKPKNALYRLYPYFGGTFPSPHDIQLHITEK